MYWFKRKPNINLLQETLETFKRYNKTENDVDWVGIKDKFYSTWEDFKEIAKDIFYYDGYGAVEINEIVIVFKDGSWLEREEYDGSEWWAYKEKPLRPNTYKKIIKEDICTDFCLNNENIT